MLSINGHCIEEDNPVSNTQITLNGKHTILSIH